MKTVYVGLSGGVDSATSAYLLKKEGYNVVAAFIKGWEPDFLPCTGKEDRQEAMRVAAHLEIPFVTYDLETEYKREVVDYFIAEYKAGRTPNPDVICNRTIKFGSFWEKAKADGADFIATGHYARIVEGDRGLTQTERGRTPKKTYTLRTSADREKDQTYFLWTLTQDDLVHSLFPVGSYEKTEIRKIAEHAGLPNAKRRDSQGVCFLGHVDMHAFLKRYIPEKRGHVIDGYRKIIGEHDGVWFYTLGQHMPLAAGKRMYVVGKKVQENELIVSETPLGESAQTDFSLHSVNWISGTSPKRNILARYRYRQPLLPVRIGGNIVVFETPQLIAEGQSCVFYDANGLVYGGGIIG